jgi:hypothetical protein
VIAADSWFLSPRRGRSRGRRSAPADAWSAAPPVAHAGVHGVKVKAPQQLGDDQQAFGLGKAGADAGVRPLAEGYVGAVHELTFVFRQKALGAEACGSFQ